MKKIIFISILFFFISSCETTLDIELPSVESKLVINSYMISNQYWDSQSQFVLVSNSIEGMGSINDYTYTDSIPVINNATASIYEIISEENNNVLDHFPLEFDPNCYCYTNPSFTPKENKTYQLNVSADGYPEIISTEKMPLRPNYTISNFQPPNNLDQIPIGDLCEFNIKLEDTPNQKNYYRLKIFAVNTFESKAKSCEYEVQDPSFLIPINRYNTSNNYYKGRSGYFVDELFEGEEKDLFITIEKPRGAYDHFYVELTSYSENLYNFNLTRKEQNRDSNNFIFNSEAIFIESNIEGGYGIFGGRAISKKAYIPTYFPIHGWIEY